MNAIFLDVLLGALLLFGAGIAYILPLRKREKWLLWLPAMFLLCLLCLGMNYEAQGAWWIVSQLLMYACLVLMVNRTTRLSLAGACYCAVWVLISGELIHILWMGLLLAFPVLSGSLWLNSLGQLAFAVVCCLTIALTVAKWMPQGDVYLVGPRQLFSAIALGCVCVSLGQYFIRPHDMHLGLSMLYLMGQIYCVSLLYLQTELFKKSQLQKDLDALNFLYSCEQQQYAAACQNVSVVIRKCEELEKTIAQMRQHLPPEEQEQLPVMEALRASDTMVRSGNDVLDIVLTEKKLLAEASGIRIDCVADGKLLDFMEVVDIYALFSNALDNAIEAVEKLPDRSHRLIDVLVHESQNFLVVNISNPMKASLEFEEDLPVTTKTRNSFHGYGLRVLRHAVEKYHGMISVEAKKNMFILKVLIPLSGRKK